MSEHDSLNSAILYSHFKGMDLSELYMSVENTEHNLAFLLSQGYYLSINYGLFGNHNDL